MAERKLLDITSLQRAIRLGDLYTRKGKISKIMGLMVEATGLECNMGDICRIQLSKERYALAEVVGILEDTVQLMPYQELDGIGSGSVVTRDIPPRTLAYGNPCRPVRAITEADSVADALAEAGLV